MVYDASNIWANYKFNDSFYYLKRQLIFATVGAFILLVESLYIELENIQS